MPYFIIWEARKPYDFFTSKKIVKAESLAFNIEINPQVFSVPQSSKITPPESVHHPQSLENPLQSKSHRPSIPSSLQYHSDSYHQFPQKLF